jgi:hypothetical protein
MLYSTFEAQVRRQLEESSPNVWSAASLLHWTNEAARDVARKGKPLRDEQYATLTVGQDSYALPDYTLSIISMIYEANGNRTELLRRDVHEISLYTSLSAPPTYYAVDDENIYLYPTPDYAGVLRFWRYHRPTPVTADSDTVPFGEEYSTAMEYFVFSRAFEQIGDWESASQYRDRYNQAVDELSAHEMGEDSSSSSSPPVEVY